MVKQIIALTENANGNITLALWLSVPVARRPFFADVTKTSAWTGASAAENIAIQNGEVHEELVVISSTGKTNNELKADAEALFTARQTEFNNENPWRVYGTFFDDQTQWTNGGVA